MCRRSLSVGWPRRVESIRAGRERERESVEMRVKDFHVARTFSPLPYLGGKNAGNLVLEPWCPSVTVPCPVRASFARDKEFLSGGEKKKS